MNIRSLALGVLSCVAALCSHALAQQTPNPRFSDAFGAFGVDGTISSMVEWDPDGPGPQGTWLVVAGGFAHAGKVRATNIAAFDGERWRALGALGGDFRATQPRTVQSLAVHEGVLYAGGTFETADGVNTGGFVRRVGDTWERVLPAGTLVSPHVFNLRSTPLGLVFHEFVRGSGFWSWSAGGLYLLQGGTLSPLPSPNALINPVVAFEGSLYGLEQRQPGPSRVVRCMNGVWSPLTSPPGWLSDVFVFDGVLYAAAGPALHAWQGGVWSPLPVLSTNLDQPWFYNFEFGGDLAVQAHSNDWSHNCVYYTGRSETSVFINGMWVRTPLPRGVRPLATYQGGQIGIANNQLAWLQRDQAPAPFGEPLDGLTDPTYGYAYPRAVAGFDGKHIAAGNHIESRGRPLGAVAYRAADGWRDLFPTPRGTSVQWMEASNNFMLINILSRDPRFCDSLQQFQTIRLLPGAAATEILPLRYHDFRVHAVDPVTGDQAVSGYNENNGSHPIYIVTPTGQTLIPPPTAAFRPEVLGFHDGRLHAIDNNSFWVLNDNGVWDPLPILFDPMPSSGKEFRGMISHAGSLYLYGAFGIAVDDRPGFVRDIARWDGARWLSVGHIQRTTSSTNDGIYDAESFGDDLYVVGAISAADGKPVRNFARWDGSGWFNVGGGANGRVTEIAAVGQSLAIAGFFSEAGGHVAFANTTYTPNPCQADLNADGTPDLADFFTFFDCFDRQDPCADVNDDTVVDLNDFFGFLDAYDRQCR